MNSAAGIILTGGRSRRMGREKGLLPLPGNEQYTFVERLSLTLSSQCSEVILVARDREQARLYQMPNVRTVVDVVPDVGPLMGLYSGLRAMQATHALVTAVDMPLVQPAIIHYLLAFPQDDTLLVPVVKNIPQVLFAVYPRTVLPLIEQRLQEGRRDPRSLLTLARVRYIEEAQLRLIEPQLRSFLNVNTPEELAALQQPS
ncbi:molybdopterin-guanine dinucleotide biosynthesis protein A [Thermosporothrix hazakensis]|uniref:Probable molybdenum cofactor guanylyltransferase n=2 Tax=Thermosporothrix TaxID=768650 RepID=A0A326UG04_THEHA|nr:molybdenum cofactor guanylyltransferase [Thermosporothrix hazakensis]PZW36701.1 molybdopterin-guanine dinucleotide biosynthesis protein A [Thermosporothrix hazakensis]BBH89169.1 putative molybdenum cofactor guanylyltransferase [Thermosporothrix sp. COM3]GCE47352.1 putative molybdenum cofactor guanylyltransferase [Thermosporothrix hazakensis]